MSSIRPNAALLSNALAYAPQMPLDPKMGSVLGEFPPVPAGLTYPEEGFFRLNFHAPTAATVTVMVDFREHTLEKESSGLWHITLPIGNGGMKPVFFRVDGVSVLHPMLPMGFGASSPCNMLDLPQPRVDFYHLKDVPHGAVTQEFYYSSLTGRHESCLVYTPPGYMNGTDIYPVLYLQHGHGENEKCWVHQGKVNFILDNLIAAGQAEPCIIVMNNGMVQSTNDNGDTIVDMTLLPKLIVQDCIPYIEKTYRVKPGRENRAVAGLSMGSMHASVMTMTWPELFPWAGIFSGFVQVPTVLQSSNSHLDALKDVDKFRADHRLFFRAMGQQDPFLGDFRSDRELLERSGLSPALWENHKEILYPGSHDWNVWRMCIRDFLQLIFR